jgi:hypothetical protein
MGWEIPTGVVVVCVSDVLAEGNDFGDVVLEY